MSAQTVSVIGCGWLGLPLAEQLIAERYDVKGSTTSVDKVALLTQKRIKAYQLQLNPAPTGDLKSLLDADTLIINIPPKTRKLGDDFHPKQIHQLVEAVRLSSIKHIIYVSSTSVYPEQNQLAVEDDVSEEIQSAAPALVKAERLVQSLATDRTVTILRCGGLMGYDRIPGKYVAGKIVNSGDIPVNYLHRDDAVGILVTLIRLKLSGVFNAVAPEHPAREPIYRKSCADFGYVVPTFVEPLQPVSYKIISPEKLIQAATYSFLYPDPLQFLYRR